MDNCERAAEYNRYAHNRGSQLGFNRIHISKKKVRNPIGAALQPSFSMAARIIPLYRSRFCNRLPTSDRKSSRRVYRRFPVVRIELWKRLPGNVIQQFTVGAEADFAGIFLGRLDVFFERPVGLLAL